MSDEFDVVVLGGGSAGYSAALRAAQLGQHVALIERELVGGTCLHRGCIPTKALLHSAEVAESVRESERFGVRATLDAIDVAAVNKYKQSVVDRLYKGLRGLIGANKIEVITGSGVLVDSRSIVVGDRILRGDSLVIATGAKSRLVSAIPLGKRIISSEKALELDELPASAIVVGGGVIGVEFASLWASWGIPTTILEAADRLAVGEDEWTSAQLSRGLRNRGIKIRTGVTVESAVEVGECARVTLSDGEVVEAAVLLLAVGRDPDTADCGLDKVGVDVDERGYVRVDDYLATNIDGIYAVGDIVGGPQLAHRGFQHGIAVAERICGMTVTRPPDVGIPRVTYSTPQVASVGLTEAQARATHGVVDVMTYDLAGNGKAQISGSGGGVKVIREQERGEVVGIHMVGDGVGELIGEAQLIYNWSATAADVAPHIHAHPTIGESLGEVHLALAGKPLHMHS